MMKTRPRFTHRSEPRLGRLLLLGLFLLLLASPLATHAQRQMENLDRGVVAVRKSSTEAFISWRLLALEPQNIGFNVYRSANSGAAVKLNSAPLTNGCNYTDAAANLAQTNAYYVRAVSNGVELAASPAWTLPASSFTGPLLRIPLQTPANNKIQHVSVGDLDGDGQYEVVISWSASVVGETQKLQAYQLDGTLLWTYDAGIRSTDPDDPRVYGTACIVAGQWDGVAVYDLDGDGRAEVIVKSADGVTFGDGKKLVCGDTLTQFISVLDGMTGAERTRTELINPWKTLDNKRSLSVLFGIGYPDGQRPSLMIHAKSRTSTGAFNTINSAWDFRGGVISNRWSIHWDGAVAPEAGHQMRAVDLDGDGKDELFPGVHAVDDNGTLLYDMGNWGIGHGDRWQVGDINPNRPGQEIFAIGQNDPTGLRYFVADAATGQLLWTWGGTNIVDVGRGSAVDIDPRYPGMEVWAFDGVNACDGTWITTNNHPWPNLTVWWDADLLGENLNENIIEKWNYLTESVGRTLTCYNYYNARANSRNVTPFYGDVIGDWREEVMFEGGVNREWLLVFTTSTETTNRLYSLAQNPAYRNCLTQKGYLQQNLPDYYLGEGMSNPPTPNIVYVPLSPPPAAPAAPTGFGATAASSPHINLVWTDNSTNEDGFQIERSTNGVDFVQLWVTTANTTNYSDTGLKPATTYHYRVRASNLGGQSAYTGVASATTPVFIAVTATLPGTSTTNATAPALATSSSFDMNGGNAVALLVTSENSSTTTNVSAIFAGQSMTLGVWTNQANQWAGIFYLVNPATTVGAFEITGDQDSLGLAYSAIALGSAGSIAGLDAVANTVNAGEFDLVNTTLTNGGFVLGAAVNNGFSSSRPGPAFVSGPADQFLLASTLIGSSGHLHNYGTLPTAGAYTNTYANINGTGARNAYVTLAFERTSTPPPAAPMISSVSLSGGNLILGGTNGPVGATYYVLTSTNLMLPLANWTIIATSSVSANAAFVFSNAIPPGSAQGFYRLRVE